MSWINNHGYWVTFVVCDVGGVAGDKIDKHSCVCVYFDYYKFILNEIETGSPSYFIDQQPTKTKKRYLIKLFSQVNQIRVK